jgi:hypothetical protein
MPELQEYRFVGSVIALTGDNGLKRALRPPFRYADLPAAAQAVIEIARAGGTTTLYGSPSSGKSLLAEFARYAWSGSRFVGAEEFGRFAANTDFANKFNDDAEALHLYGAAALQAGQIRDVLISACKSSAPRILDDCISSGTVGDGRRQSADQCRYVSAIDQIMFFCDQEGYTTLNTTNLAPVELKSRLPERIYSRMESGLVEVRGSHKRNNAEKARRRDWKLRVQAAYEAARNAGAGERFLQLAAAADDAVDLMSGELSRVAHAQLRALVGTLPAEAAKQVADLFGDVLRQAPAPAAATAPAAAEINERALADAEREFRHWLGCMMGNEGFSAGVAKELWAGCCVRWNLPALPLPAFADFAVSAPRWHVVCPTVLQAALDFRQNVERLHKMKQAASPIIPHADASAFVQALQKTHGFENDPRIVRAIYFTIRPAAATSQEVPQ